MEHLFAFAFTLLSLISAGNALKCSCDSKDVDHGVPKPFNGFMMIQIKSILHGLQSKPFDLVKTACLQREPSCVVNGTNLNGTLPQCLLVRVDYTMKSNEESMLEAGSYAEFRTCVTGNPNEEMENAGCEVTDWHGMHATICRCNHSDICNQETLPERKVAQSPIELNHSGRIGLLPKMWLSLALCSVIVGLFE